MLDIQLRRKVKKFAELGNCRMPTPTFLSRKLHEVLFESGDFDRGLWNNCNGYWTLRDEDTEVYGKVTFKTKDVWVLYSCNRFLHISINPMAYSHREFDSPEFTYCIKLPLTGQELHNHLTALKYCWDEEVKSR